MELKLGDLGAPSEFWDYFEQITKIPRCSGKEEQVRIFIKNEAKNLGFESKVDSSGNIVVRIPSKREVDAKKKIILQCHLDMVYEKNQDVVHDFLKEPLKIKVIEIDGEKWITADGTTLGADNGVGIAYALTLMKKIHDGELSFDSLAIDVLFTVDEETGLTGAKNIARDFIDGDYLINLDSEEDDRVTIGCAGGNHFTIDIKMKIEEINVNSQEVIPMEISISGLMGGHSGVDIHKRRANAIKILAQILWKINSRYSISIDSIKGGNKHNAIPREAQITLIIKKEDEIEIRKLLKQIMINIKQNFGVIEPNINVSLEKSEKVTNCKVFTKSDHEKLINILFVIPNGVISMHPKINGLVHTSTNLAAIDTIDNTIKLLISQRSLSDYSLKVIHERIRALFKLIDLKYEFVIHGEYPSWNPDFNSKLLEYSKESYKTLFNEDIIVQAIHAGLECAMFKKHYPKMEMISIGPNIVDVHSPDERLSVSSVKKFWKFLPKLIGKFV